MVCRQAKAGPRKLKVQLPEIATTLQDMAADPQAWLGRGGGAAGAAWLCFRELVCSWCSLQAPIAGCIHLSDRVWQRLTTHADWSLLGKSTRFEDKGRTSKGVGESK